MCYRGDCMWLANGLFCLSTCFRITFSARTVNTWITFWNMPSFFFFILVSYYECHWLLFNFENPRTMPTMWSWLPGTARQLLYSDYSGCTFFFFGSGPDSPMQVVRTAADNWLRPFGVAQNFCSSTTIVRRFSSFTIINTSFVLIIAEVT